MRRGIFVCFIGTDGSGKSTLANNIYNKLQGHINRPVLHVYGRHKPLISKLLIRIGRLVFLRNKNMFSDYDIYLKDKREQFRKSSGLVKIYLRILSAEYLVQMFFKICIPLKLGYTIVADRYVYDTIVNDLAIDQDLNDADVKLQLIRYWRYLPKPDFVFLIKVSEETALSRKRDIPSASFLQIRNKLYESISREEENIQILDGNLDPSNLESTVIRAIQSKLKDVPGSKR